MSATDRIIWTLLAGMTLWGSACGDTEGNDPGTSARGDLRLSVAANEAVRVGFPHEENGAMLAFVDGWSFSVERFIISLGKVQLQQPTNDGRGPVLAEWVGPALVDVASEEDGDVELATLNDVPAKRLDIRFDLVLPQESMQTIGVPEDQKERMLANDWSMLLQGVATPTDQNNEYVDPINIDFGFTIEANYFDCVNGSDNTKGLVVAPNSTSDAYLYPHLVHFFWDTLGAGNEELRFSPMAEVAGDDGVVTLEDLQAQDLTELLGPEGIPLYDDAGLIETYSLRAFVERAALESLHFNGIGFCKKRLGTL